MKRKLQIFVSSTYEDLLVERQAAVKAILEAGHISAGMELFSAGDESQLEVIRRWIRESDIFMLILGGRYGSIEPKSKKSYIHVEYDYAVEIEKPLFSILIHQDYLDKKVKKDGIAVHETENTAAFRHFKADVKSRMCAFFEDTKDIELAIHKSIKALESRYGDAMTGWLEGSSFQGTFDDVPIQAENEILQQVATDLGLTDSSLIPGAVRSLATAKSELQRENGALESRVEAYQSSMMIRESSVYLSLRKRVETYNDRWKIVFDVWCPSPLTLTLDSLVVELHDGANEGRPWKGDYTHEKSTANWFEFHGGPSHGQYMLWIKPRKEELEDWNAARLHASAVVFKHNTYVNTEHPIGTVRKSLVGSLSLQIIEDRDVARALFNDFMFPGIEKGVLRVAQHLGRRTVDDRYHIAALVHQDDSKVLKDIIQSSDPWPLHSNQFGEPDEIYSDGGVTIDPGAYVDVDGVRFESIMKDEEFQLIGDFSEVYSSHQITGPEGRFLEIPINVLAPYLKKKGASLVLMGEHRRFNPVPVEDEIEDNHLHRIALSYSDDGLGVENRQIGLHSTTPDNKPCVITKLFWVRIFTVAQLLE